MKIRLTFCLVIGWFVGGCEFVIARAPSAEGGASVLIYNLYTSSATMPFKENTRLAFTNTSETASVTLHLFLIANDCKVTDQFIALTANQTAATLASELDPGVRGFLVAVAVDRVTGCPIKFNHLIGEAAIKLATGHRATLPAEGIRALRENPAECVAATGAAGLRFDGERYEVLPRVLSVDNLGSRFDGYFNVITVNAIGGDWRVRVATTGVLFGLFFDDEESGVSLQLGGNCQVMGEFPPNPFPRLPPPNWGYIGQGHTGWLRLWSPQRDMPLLGAVFSYNANESLMPSLFTGGRNMHCLRYSTAGELILPVFPPM